MTFCGAVEKCSFAALRCKPRRSMYVYIQLAVRFFRALHLNIFEQSSNMEFFNNPSVSY
jgi:hypothetical protein